MRIAIIGAGFAGIGQAVLLKQAGLADITLFERAPSLGGTWRDNAYPGAACDVPSHLYSFSFAPNPHWSARYASQAEILAYLAGVADRFGITPHIRLNTPVRRAALAADLTWRIELDDGLSERFDIVITAVGQLSQPATPPFPGLETFAGDAFHSARWNPSVPLAGRRVALIGAAASAVQIAPELAPLAAQLTVFQRTPNWIIPRFQGTYGTRRRALFARTPGLRRAFRFWLWQYQEWLWGAFRAGSRRNALLQRLARWHLRRQVTDPAIREQLTPAYTLGCKRLLVSDDYLPVFNRANVRLVTDPIAGFEPAGIRTQDGALHPADVAIFATGFDVRHCLTAIAITGRDGATLAERWRDGPAAFAGIAVPDFPNLFLLYGPGTNLGHSSIILMLEAQARAIVRLLHQMRARGVAALEIAPESYRAYDARLQQALERMVWNTGCTNWYGEGGRISTNWSGSTLDYIRMMRRLDSAAFIGLRQSSSSTPSTSIAPATALNA